MLDLCDRWHKTPDEIYACDAATLMRLLTLERYRRPPAEQPDPYAEIAGWAG